jgi:hypothetical protein
VLGAGVEIEHRHDKGLDVSTNSGRHICLLTGVEVRRWEYHEQPPAGCERRKHKHISEGEAREMVHEGQGRLALIAGLWRVVPTSTRKWVSRMSGGFVVRQLVKL